jgi:hypothetical protein
MVMAATFTTLRPELSFPATNQGSVERNDMSGNRMRWQPGRRGHYDGWFVAFSSPEEAAASMPLAVVPLLLD